MNEKPMTDAEIEHAEGLPATVECRGVILRLVAEVRRLKSGSGYEQSMKELREINAQLGGKVFAADVELDNLRKMLEDSNQREEQQIGAAADLRRQRDDARDARDGALKQAEAAEAKALLYDKTLHKTLGSLHIINARAASIVRWISDPNMKPDVEAMAIIEERGKAHTRIVDAVNPKPVPMCKPDPLEDIMPAVEGSGGCC